jgi:hypothetical protein
MELIFHINVQYITQKGNSFCVTFPMLFQSGIYESYFNLTLHWMIIKRLFFILLLSNSKIIFHCENPRYNKCLHAVITVHVI